MVPTESFPVARAATKYGLAKHPLHGFYDEPYQPLFFLYLDHPRHRPTGSKIFRTYQYTAEGCKTELMWNCHPFGVWKSSTSWEICLVANVDFRICTPRVDHLQNCCPAHYGLFYFIQNPIENGHRWPCVSPLA